MFYIRWDAWKLTSSYTLQGNQTWCTTQRCQSVSCDGERIVTITSSYITMLQQNTTETCAMSNTQIFISSHWCEHSQLMAHKSVYLRFIVEFVPLYPPFWLLIHIFFHLLALLDQHPRFARPQKTRATSYKMQINHGSKFLSYICSVLMCTQRIYFQFKSCLQLNIDKHIQHKVVGIWLLWIHMGTKYIWARNDITMHIVSIYIVDQYCDS